MVVAVTGASGFLGRRLIEQLSPQCEILALSRFPEDQPKLNGVVWVKANSQTQLSKIADSVTVVIHLATNYGRTFIDPIQVVETNVTYPLRLFTLFDKAKLFLYADSYYNQYPNNPRLPLYTATKRQFDELVTILWRHRPEPRPDLVRCVLQHVYGPGDSQEKFIPSLANALLRDEQFDFASGDHIRDFIYVDDAASAIAAVVYASLESRKSRLEPSAGFVEYDIGTGRGTSVKQLAQLMAIVARSKSNLKFGSLADDPFEIFSSIANNEAVLETGWAPTIDLGEGLQRTLEEACKYRAFSKKTHKQ